MNEIFKRNLAMCALTTATFLGSSAIGESVDHAYRDDKRACKVENVSMNMRETCIKDLGENDGVIFNVIAIGALAASIFTGLRTYQAHQLSTTMYVASNQVYTTSRK